MVHIDPLTLVEETSLRCFGSSFWSLPRKPQLDWNLV